MPSSRRPGACLHHVLSVTYDISNAVRRREIGLYGSRTVERRRQPISGRQSVAGVQRTRVKRKKYETNCICQRTTFELKMLELLCRRRRKRRHALAHTYVLSPVSIQAQSCKRKLQETQAPANRNTRSKQWLLFCVSCGFRLRNARNASFTRIVRTRQRRVTRQTDCDVIGLVHFVCMLCIVSIYIRFSYVRW